MQNKTWRNWAHAEEGNHCRPRGIFCALMQSKTTQRVLTSNPLSVINIFRWSRFRRWSSTASVIRGRAWIVKCCRQLGWFQKRPVAAPSCRDMLFVMRNLLSVFWESQRTIVEARLWTPSTGTLPISAAKNYWTQFTDVCVGCHQTCKELPSSCIRQAKGQSKSDGKKLDWVRINSNESTRIFEWWQDVIVPRDLLVSEKPSRIGHPSQRHSNVSVTRIPQILMCNVKLRLWTAINNTFGILHLQSKKTILTNLDGTCHWRSIKDHSFLVRIATQSRMFRLTFCQWKVTISPSIWSESCWSVAHNPVVSAKTSCGLSRGLPSQGSVGQRKQAQTPLQTFWFWDSFEVTVSNSTVWKSVPQTSFAIEFPYLEERALIIVTVSIGHFIWKLPPVNQARNTHWAALESLNAICISLTCGRFTYMESASFLLVHRLVSALFSTHEKDFNLTIQNRVWTHGESTCGVGHKARHFKAFCCKNLFLGQNSQTPTFYFCLSWCLAQDTCESTRPTSVKRVNVCQHFSRQKLLTDRG